MDYINNLPHEPGCRKNKLWSEGGGSAADCNCPRAEVLARVEAMEAFVEAFSHWRHVRCQSLQEYSKEEGAAYNEMMAAFAKLEES